jgi:hypothetical protein
MLDVLALCAALFAPHSSGEDPSGRALHIPTQDGFNIAYEACITTVKQAQQSQVDPFTMVALTYRETGMSAVTSRKIRRSRTYKRIRQLYGCNHNERYIRGSCSVYVLTPTHFRSLLNQTIDENQQEMYRHEDYRKALCRFFSGRRTCYGKHIRSARIVENMAKRYAMVYNKSRRSFVWGSPYVPKPTMTEEYKRDRLNDIIEQLERRRDRGRQIELHIYQNEGHR